MNSKVVCEKKKIVEGKCHDPNPWNMNLDTWLTKHNQSKIIQYSKETVLLKKSLTKSKHHKWKVNLHHNKNMNYKLRVTKIL